MITLIICVILNINCAFLRLKKRNKAQADEALQKKLEKELKEKELREKVKRDKQIRQKKVELTRKIIADNRKEEVCICLFAYAGAAVNTCHADKLTN